MGAHKDLLPYLVRRLLENGANSSFVNQFLDKDTPISEIVEDPVREVSQYDSYRHPDIALPIDIYRASPHADDDRDNSLGIDLDNPLAVEALFAAMAESQETPIAAPIVSGEVRSGSEQQPVMSPAHDDKIVGYCVDATDQDIDDALNAAQRAHADWDALGGAARANILTRVGDLLEQNRASLMKLVGEPEDSPEA